MVFGELLLRWRLLKKYIIVCTVKIAFIYSVLFSSVMKQVTSIHTHKGGDRACKYLHSYFHTTDKSLHKYICIVTQIGLVAHFKWMWNNILDAPIKLFDTSIKHLDVFRVLHRRKIKIRRYFERWKAKTESVFISSPFEGDAVWQHWKTLKINGVKRAPDSLSASFSSPGWADWFWMSLLLLNLVYVKQPDVSGGPSAPVLYRH